MVDNRNTPLDDQPNESVLVSGRDLLMRQLNLSSSTQIVQAFAGMMPTQAGEMHTALGLSDDELIRLRKVARDLSETAALNVQYTANTTGIDAAKVERIRDLAVALLTDPEIYSVELDRVNFTEILLEVNAPPELLEGMAEAGITSLANVRQAGADALTQIQGITPEFSKTLTAQARFAVISPDVRLNRRLIEAGITRVGEIAQLKEHELASRIQADLSVIRMLRQRARVVRAAAGVNFLDAVVSLVPANRLSNLVVASSLPEPILRLAAPVAAPDACQTCNTCLSALNPAAYLVDLIDFLIDNFSAPPIGTASGIAPRGFTNLDDLDNRFRQSFKNLVIQCSESDQLLRQVEIAIEVLEKFITTPPVTGYSRDLVYDQFDYVDPRGRTLPKPDILSRMFDAYLNEMSVTRAAFDAAVGQAYPVGGVQPDLTKLNQLLLYLGIAEAEFKTQLGIQNANWKPTIKALDWMPTLLRAFKTKAFNPNNLQQLTLYQDALDQAAAAVGRVKEYALPDIRTNLIAFALRQLQRAGVPEELASITTVKRLSNYLHIDLATDACMTTTRLASAIEAIQSFIFAFNSGREDPGYFLTFQGGVEVGSFDARWRWMKSYSLWHAAQSVLLYPENFLMPNVRQGKTPIFDSLLTALEGLNSAESRAIDLAVTTYRQAALNEWSVNGIQFFDLPVTNFGLGLEAFNQRQSADYARQAQLRAVNNQLGDALRVFLDEWYFDVPLAVADYLSKMSQFESAADWYHVVFHPFTAQYPPDFPFPPIRLVWWGFSEAKDQSYVYRNTVEWLTDPFDPFAVARTRQGAFLRHVIIRYIENLLDWADAEFSRDTSESISRAREIYEVAEDILYSNEIPQEEACRAAWRELITYILASYSTEEVRLLQLIIVPVQNVGNRLTSSDITAMGDIVKGNDPFADRLTDLKQLVDQIVARQAPAKTASEIAQERAECQIPELVEDAYTQPIGSPSFPRPIWPELDLSPVLTIVEFTLSKIGCGFCVPPNPLIETLRFRIETNLEKIRTCRNYAGMQRKIATYAAPADPTTLIQQAASGGDLDEAVPTEPPSVFRFSYLIERARYYVQVAQQLESQLLEAFKAGDDAKYSELKARQDIKLAQANLALQVLRVAEANDNIELARLQTARARFQATHFADLIAADLLPYEIQSIDNLWAAHDWAIAATVVGGIGEIGGAIAGAIVGGIYGNAPGAAAGAVVGGIASAIAGGGHLFQGISNVKSLYSQARSMQATFERRKQDWELQEGLATRDIQIGEQGITVSTDRLSITEQEHSIANLQSQFATEVVNFLAEKFTSKDLWDWMGRVLRQYYRQHLNFATVMARLAQTALAFERQEALTFVAPYYSEHERRDLLSAEQLLTDINRLDQHRLTTQKRLKELTKTISLASIAPSEFEQLRREGWMEFATLMEWFDRDFPGHYMRLIKTINLTVIGLIPGGEMIRATLSNKGTSRVMVGPPFNEFKEILRQPESIAVSTASNGTGLFELHLDDPILLPFEGHGVATIWTLEMPKGANRFDFNTLTDVLLTIRFTAQDDTTYREKVLTAIGIDANRKVNVEGTTSMVLSNAYPDAWYHLNNPIIRADGKYGYEPGETLPPYELQFEVRQRDFPPNEVDNKMNIVNLAFRQTHTIVIPVLLEFESEGQQYRVEMDYNWDTGNANTGPLRLTAFTHLWDAVQQQWNAVVTPLSALSPKGRWRLKLRLDADRTNPNYTEFFKNATQTRLDLSWLTDALFVISYSAKVEYKYGRET